MKNIFPALFSGFMVGLVCVIFLPKIAVADSDVKFHGSLIVVSCQVNQDKMVNVPFGSVGVKKVDGVNYSQTIPFAVTCNNMGSEQNPGLTLSVTGQEASFDDAAVVSDVDGLAVRIMKDGQPLKLNTETEISYSPQPVLTAVPVKGPGVELSTGDFHATATLVVHVA